VILLKSDKFRVINVRSYAIAVAAMMASGKLFPRKSITEFVSIK
jgi:hypothetical protein